MHILMHILMRLNYSWDAVTIKDIKSTMICDISNVIWQEENWILVADYASYLN